ncbi:alpha-actinin-2-like [Lytechinus pictus]|uniref:alpha-actinin-2-like n=1 Tax=Lytechinus pictus TaxID=7653 RepID=UPI0030BA1A6D
MLKWINSVLPEDAGVVKNFSTDWNSGVILSALLNYCDPELMPNWRELDKSNGLENCREAMRVANEKYGIPMVVSPEDLSNKHIDELSGMTYFSYFLKHEGPGWYATLNWVRKNVPEEDVQNFKSDWNDGLVLCGLVNAVGGDCSDWKDMDRDDKINNCHKGIIRTFIFFNCEKRLYLSTYHLTPFKTLLLESLHKFYPVKGFKICRLWG